MARCSLHPLVEALVAAAQQRDLAPRRPARPRARRRTGALRRQRDHPAPAAIIAVARRQRRLDHVDADDHARPAAVGRVVHLARLERRGRAQVDGLERAAELERVAHVALLEEPVEPGGEQREYVDLHPRKSSLTLDLAPLDRPDRVRNERHQRSVLQLQHRAGRPVEHAHHAAVPGHRAAQQVGRQPLVLRQLRLDQQQLATQRARVRRRPRAGSAAARRCPLAARPRERRSATVRAVPAGSGWLAPST